MPFTPSTAAVNTVTLAGSNMANLSTPLTALQASIAGGNTAPAAYIDAILSAVGYQAQSDAAALGSTTTTSTSFGDVGNGSTTGYSTWTATAPIAKTYLIRVDLSCYVTVAAGSVYFQLLADGTAITGQPTAAARHFFSTTTQRHRLSWVVPASLTAASHTFKLQWKVDSGVTGNVDAVDFRCFTMSG